MKLTGHLGTTCCCMICCRCVCRLRLLLLLLACRILFMKLSYDDEISTRSMVFLPSCSVHDRLSTRAASKIFLLAERGFDQRTSGLWAQHASTAPLCYCPLSAKRKRQIEKDCVVRSGIRTHAHRSGLRPERSALDLSAILTEMTNFSSSVRLMTSQMWKDVCPKCGKSFSPTGNRTRAFHVTGGDPHH